MNRENIALRNLVSPFRIINLEVSQISLIEARAMLNSAILNFRLPENFNHEEFRQLANGFFQAEGCVSARIKGLYISPVVVLTQNLSNESLVFFVTLLVFSR
jgi:hypothetical protein